MENMLIMLIGLPASGKSTYAMQLKDLYPEYIIHSSDELRKELYGDVDDQEHNTELFEELNRRIAKDIKSGKTVVYDATNLNKKRRVDFLRRFRCKKKAVLFIKDIKDCKQDNKRREKEVPDIVIDKMRLTFNPPHWHEGFDDIEVIRNKVNPFVPMVKETLSFNQDNSHHSLTLGKHLLKTAENFTDDDYEVKTAAYFHDIGKLYTKSKYNCKGEEDGDAHYYNHHQVGAYEFLCSDAFFEDDLESGLYIANLIYYHMHPYISWKQSQKAKKKDKKLIGEKMYEDILRLHDADVKAH